MTSRSREIPSTSEWKRGVYRRAREGKREGTEAGRETRGGEKRKRCESQEVK